MHFKHKKGDHGEQSTPAESEPIPDDAAESEPGRVCHVQGAHLVCSRLEEIAVPEVSTGLVECCEDLDDEPCPICYETAIPEVHMSALRHCPEIHTDDEN